MPVRQWVMSLDFDFDFDLETLDQVQFNLGSEIENNPIREYESGYFLFPSTLTRLVIRHLMLTQSNN